MQRQIFIVGLALFITGLVMTLLMLNQIASISGAYYEYPFLTQQAYYAKTSNTLFLTTVFSFLVLLGASLIRRSGRTRARGPNLACFVFGFYSLALRLPCPRYLAMYISGAEPTPMMYLSMKSASISGISGTTP